MTSILAVHHGGGIGGAPVSMLKLLAALDPGRFASSAVFTEDGPILDFGRRLEVECAVVPAGGAFFYSAHARLAPRTIARFLRTLPAAVMRARAALRERQPDLVHLNTSVLVAWAIAARRERIPVLWMVREVLGPNPGLRARHARFILGHATRVVATSDAVRGCFPPDAKLRRVYNAVDLREFDPALLPARDTVRGELGIGTDEPVVMAIGSVQREKGHWLLVDALSHAATLVPGVRLVLVCGGVGADYEASTRGRVKRVLGMPLDNLEALMRHAAHRGASQRITVTGFRQDVARLLAAADVVAFPSLKPEGFGRPIVEAMAMRRPVVATDIGPSAELLGPDAGLLVQPQAHDLARALVTFLRSAGLRERAGTAGRARVEELFTLDRQVREMEALYEEVACAA